MAKLLKLRRGTTSQHSSFTGAEGEVTIDTTKDTAVVHDGSTAAGRPLAREDLNNVSSSTIAGRLSNDSLATSKIAAGALPTDVTVASANIVNGTIATGDIANSAITSDKLNNTAVTFAKMQNVSQDTLIGRTASGSGAATDLAASQVRALLNVENGATADQSASEILTLIKTVDGSGSGLDADTLDGISSASFVRSDASDTLTGTYTFAGSYDQKIILNGTDPYIRWQEGGTNKAYIQWNSAGYLDIVNQETSDFLRLGNGSTGLQWYDGAYRTVWTSGNDGSGSGLDADTTDGYHASTSESGNTLATRNSSGYLFANYFNGTGTFGTGGNSSGMQRFTGTNGSDTYGRSYTAAAARTLLNVANGATNVTNNNQISNGAGYITSSSLSSYLPKSGGTMSGTITSYNIQPYSNNAYDLGTSSYRYRNIYTNDLNLSNEGSSNDVDGSWGDWTIQEGESDLFLKNNRSGKKFKFNLTEVS
tara:strand:+ start:11565 stop:13001 length:1437 start_codon:yes stop_codon:yes gene_type:complete